MHQKKIQKTGSQSDTDEHYDIYVYISRVLLSLYAILAIYLALRTYLPLS